MSNSKPGVLRTVTAATLFAVVGFLAVGPSSPAAAQQADGGAPARTPATVGGGSGGGAGGKVVDAVEGPLPKVLQPADPQLLSRIEGLNSYIIQREYEKRARELDAENLNQQRRVQQFSTELEVGGFDSKNAIERAKLGISSKPGQQGLPQLGGPGGQPGMGPNGMPGMDPNQAPAKAVKTMDPPKLTVFNVAGNESASVATVMNGDGRLFDVTVGQNIEGVGTVTAITASGVKTKKGKHVQTWKVQ